MTRFRYEADPGNPGWMIWELLEGERFNAVLGPLLIRVDDGEAMVRWMPQRRHSNFHGGVHGGALMGFIDSALFAGAAALGCKASEGVTVECGTHFLGVAAIGEFVDARIEVTRETGRMLFLRMVLSQQGEAVAAAQGILRKLSAARA